MDLLSYVPASAEPVVRFVLLIGLLHIAFAPAWGVVSAILGFILSIALRGRPLTAAATHSLGHYVLVGCTYLATIDAASRSPGWSAAFLAVAFWTLYAAILVSLYDEYTTSAKMDSAWNCFWMNVGIAVLLTWLAFFARAFPSSSALVHPLLAQTYGWLLQLFSIPVLGVLAGALGFFMLLVPTAVKALFATRGTVEYLATH